ncbi:hypothetical protein F0562_012355 [Nyssa sinensis]|uniref:Uncharacterized protein n=1 Tax=Nyssa sinensis TaxID=561372 RepID=A0A5J4ZSE6_9ASTE|nr:hypothetical protein F0562_012355 [Nyssa sinensis]
MLRLSRRWEIGAEGTEVQQGFMQIWPYDGQRQKKNWRQLRQEGNMVRCDSFDQVPSQRPLTVVNDLSVSFGNGAENGD